jgi:hypothetical protein
MRNAGGDEGQVVVFGDLGFSRTCVDPPAETCHHTTANKSLEGNTRQTRFFKVTGACDGMRMQKIERCHGWLPDVLPNVCTYEYIPTFSNSKNGSAGICRCGAGTKKS